MYLLFLPRWFFTPLLVSHSPSGWALALLGLALAVVGIQTRRWGWLAGAVAAALLSMAGIVDGITNTVTNLLNLLTLLLVCGGVAAMFFRQRVDKTNRWLLATAPVVNESIAHARIAGLPAPVRHWLMASGCLQQPFPCVADIQQSGKMRLRPGSRWLPFTASQYSSVFAPAFSWDCRVRYGLFHLYGHDQLMSGRASMRISLAGMLPLVRSANNRQLVSGALTRWLAEICWMPAAAIGPRVTWQAIDACSAKAMVRIPGFVAEAVFSFDEAGHIVAFSTHRWKGSGKKAQKLPWTITMNQWTAFAGVRIPVHCNICWQVPGGVFEWMELEVADVRYYTHATLNEVTKKQ